MIKILLKHLVYEKCLDLLFDGVINNFTQPEAAFLTLSDKKFILNLYENEGDSIEHLAGVYYRYVNNYIHKAISFSTAKYEILKLVNGPR